MRRLAKILALACVPAFAVTAYAGQPGGGGGNGMGGGGGMGANGAGGAAMSGGGGAILPPVGGGFSGRATVGHIAAVPPASGQTSGISSGRMSGHDDWDWRRHHHHGVFPGPVIGSGYDYGDVYNQPDVNQCWVYRKIYNARGQFVGWRHVDICAG